MSDYYEAGFLKSDINLTFSANPFAKWQFGQHFGHLRKPFGLNDT